MKVESSTDKEENGTSDRVVKRPIVPRSENSGNDKQPEDTNETNRGGGVEAAARKQKTEDIGNGILIKTPKGENHDSDIPSKKLKVDPPENDVPSHKLKADPPENDIPPDSESVPEPVDSFRLPSPWHPASRDWLICSILVLSLFIFMSIFMILMDVLKNAVIASFFGVFLGFLALISGYLIMKSFSLSEYQAVYLGHKRNSEDFLKQVTETLSQEFDGEIEKLQPISGHTFGLLSPEKTLKLSSGEILEINEFQATFGFVIGLYLLVKAPSVSKIWTILDPYLKKRN